MARAEYDPAITDILGDPAASYWLKTAVVTALSRDPVDAARDAERLNEVLQKRVFARLHAALPSAEQKRRDRHA